MTRTVTRSPAHIIPLDRALRARLRPDRRGPGAIDDSSWPEVSSRYASEDATPIRPENGQGRVLGEIALLLSVVGGLIGAVWAILPGGISP